MTEEKDNCENFDDGCTQVAPKGKFKPMEERSLSHKAIWEDGYKKAKQEFKDVVEKKIKEQNKDKKKDFLKYGKVVSYELKELLKSLEEK